MDDHSTCQQARWCRSMKGFSITRTVPLFPSVSLYFFLPCVLIAFPLSPACLFTRGSNIISILWKWGIHLLHSYDQLRNMFPQPMQLTYLHEGRILSSIYKCWSKQKGWAQIGWNDAMCRILPMYFCLYSSSTYHGELCINESRISLNLCLTETHHDALVYLLSCKVRSVSQTAA